jgi:myo-inositol-1(or 4)-monophosphatase
MDEAAEALIVDLLRREGPMDQFLGEESGASDLGATGGRGCGSGVRWVVDPLDGTVNYLYGLPHWAVSIAAEREGVAEVGVVHLPVLAETFVAVRGQGARHLKDGRATILTLGEGVALDQALIATGFAYASEHREAQAGVVAALLPKVRDIRRLGAAAVDLAQVAAGRVDGFYESGLQPWDIAAGMLIVQEAGGLVDAVKAGDSQGWDVVAGPPLTGRLLAAEVRS